MNLIDYINTNLDIMDLFFCDFFFFFCFSFIASRRKTRPESHKIERWNGETKLKIKLKRSTIGDKKIKEKKIPIIQRSRCSSAIVAKKKTIYWRRVKTVQRTIENIRLWYWNLYHCIIWLHYFHLLFHFYSQVSQSSSQHCKKYNNNNDDKNPYPNY